MINPKRLCIGCMNDNGGERICPVCGYDNAVQNADDYLPARFVIADRYVSGRVLYSNGEGVTYIGWDSGENAVIRIKEYFPTGIAHRNPDKTVSIVPGNEYKFNEGLMEFIEINRTVMNTQAPSLIPVSSVFEENGTVYAVMKNISGITLEDFLNRNGGTLKWEQARALFLPLIDTVAAMNEQGIIHRGISADTVTVSRDGKLYISDYSVKSFRVKDSGFDTSVYDGYAAIEQYGIDGMHTDTYTDVYGLCATLFRVLIGKTVPSAPQRMQSDVMSIPAHFAEELPRQVLASLANGLAVLPQNRTRDIETLKNEMIYGEIKTSVSSQKGRKTADDESEAPVKKGGSAKYAVISAVCTALVFVILAVILVFGVFRDKFRKNEEPISDDTSYYAPEVSKIGDIDSGAEVTSKLYEIPDLKGKTYAEIVADENFEMFEFSVSDKQYSDEFPRGTVCSQSIAPGGDGAVRDTKIELVISLGSKELKLAKVTGLTENEAKLELLKQGFLYENIEVLEKYDEDAKPETVVDQSPESGEKVSTEAKITIYINTYKEDDASDTGIGED